MDNRQRILNFARDNATVSMLKFILDDPDGFKVTEITGEGILNFVYRVQSADYKTSVILKRGEAFAKYTPENVVSLERQTVECEALKLFNTVEPDVAPKLYCHDTTHHIIAMEDLSHMHLLEVDLAAGKIDLELSMKIARFFARLHKSTKETNMTADKLKHIKNIFGNPEFLDDRVDFRLTKAMLESGGLLTLQEECVEMYREGIQEMTSEGTLQSLRSLMFEATCVIHGDCHPKSIFVTEGRFAIFDLEWTGLGNPAYDIGFLLAWYVMFMIESCERPGAKDIQQKILQVVRAIMHTYIDESGEEEGQFIIAVSGFMGATLFSLANFTWIDNFMRVDLRCKLHMMKLGMDLIRVFASKKVTDIESMVEVIEHDI